MKLVKLGLASILTASALFGATFNVDKTHSSVGFKVKHMMISNVTGQFDNFKGSFEYDETKNVLESLKGTVEVASINTANAKRDNHLKESDFFAAEQFPEITFVLNKVDGDKAFGKLTMRGVTKDVELEVETSGRTIKDTRGKIRVGVTLEGEVNRFDYGIKYNSLLEAGGVAIGEKVKLIIELAGVKAQ
ncbi:hypothetical protein LPB137_00760 [Poseidonibacter parvus]|uniref:Lipid/polyisoprenoid-binding YceI-like domain-containing protein n=1 Tax=Poseidonibacter parvus TaxID=1850254 RepID=A0A1P8KIT8_9BACT|nr:YceI family protein [Poseidonibacter parvus]APW64467.1 hypothetical protein LPB137_00760 [Poseidonibacter parvus]